MVRGHSLQSPLCDLSIELLKIGIVKDLNLMSLSLT